MRLATLRVHAPAPCPSRTLEDWDWAAGSRGERVIEVNFARQPRFSPSPTAHQHRGHQSSTSYRNSSPNHNFRGFLCWLPPSNPLAPSPDAHRQLSRHQPAAVAHRRLQRPKHNPQTNLRAKTTHSDANCGPCFPRRSTGTARHYRQFAPASPQPIPPLVRVLLPKDR